MNVKRMLRILIAIVTVAGGTTSPLVAQFPELREQEQRTTERPTRETVDVALPPMEAPVDPLTYVIGPSDGIGVNIWVNPPLNFALTVTPEGTLIVPTVGEIAVGGLTLDKARVKVLDAVRRRYTTGEPTMTLLRPRRVIVIVRGAVEKEGNHVLYATNRVQSAILAANPGGGFARERYSWRNIRLKRRDGSEQRVDIVRFLATHEEHWNPFVREGDDIFVPRFEGEREVIGVYGGVSIPGRYEYVVGDSLLSALDLAGGLTPRAWADSIVLSRLDPSGLAATEQIYNLLDLRAGRVPNPALQPGDRLFVKERPEYRQDYRVWIHGEVAQPGTYPITRNTTKLSHVIAKAGGFTADASLRSAELFRKSIAREDEGFEYLKSYKGIVAPHDSANYLVETALRIRKEVVQVDFYRLFVQKDSTADVYLQSEDEIFVPEASRTVYVFGQVLNPGHITYVPGKNASYYIDQAGGYGDRANESAVLVIKRVSGQAFDPRQAVVDDGDYVWVPMDPDKPAGYYLGLYAQAAVIITAITSLSLLAIQIAQ